jgi:hypothetical protein
MRWHRRRCCTEGRARSVAAAGEMFDRYGIVLRLCVNASVFAVRVFAKGLVCEVRL